MTLTKAYLSGLRVTFADGSVIDVLPEGADHISTIDPIVLSVEEARNALIDLFGET